MAEITHIARPHIYGEHLVLFVQIKDLNESESVLHHDLIGGVLNRSADDSCLFVARQKLLYQTFLLRQLPRACKLNTERNLGIFIKISFIQTMDSLF